MRRFEIQKEGWHTCPHCGKPTMRKIYDTLNCCTLEDTYHWGYCVNNTCNGYATDGYTFKNGTSIRVPKDNYDITNEKVESAELFVPSDDQYFIDDEEKSYIDQYPYQWNDFYKYFKHQFNLDKSMDKYQIGTSMYKGNTYINWWYINHNQQNTYCQRMRYKDGHRLSNDTKYSTLNQTALLAMKHGIDKSDYASFNSQFHACLFGEHLLDQDKTVLLFEAEKSAILADSCMKNDKFVCLATGGFGKMQSEKILAPLKGYRVFVMPDLDKLDETHTLFDNKLKGLFADGSKVVDWHKQYNYITDNKKADFADYLIDTRK